MGVSLRHELRLERLRERLDDRPNDLHTTVQIANLVYFLGLYDEAERFIARALELGHKDDGSLRLRLARIFVRRHAADRSNSKRYLAAALEAFSEAIKFPRVGSKAVHYLELSSVYVKINETQRAANVLATVMLRWPQSKEAAIATETCAQMLLVRRQASEALPYYKALLMEGPHEGRYDTSDGEDRAEIELPVAGGILGSASVSLQMGLCYDSLGNNKMATEAYMHSWNTLLDKRDRELATDAHVAKRKQSIRDGLPSRNVADLHSVGLSFGGDDSRTASDNDEIGVILHRAIVAMDIDNTVPLVEDALREIRDTTVGTTPTLGPFPDSRFKRFSAIASSAAVAIRVRGPGRDKAKKSAADDEQAVRTLGFEWWSKDPYTWFGFGKAVLHGGCYALALAFLDKAFGLLPPGLIQQEQERHMPVYMRRRLKPGEKTFTPPTNFSLAHLHLLRAEAFFQMGRFGDASFAAREARCLDPSGSAARRLCPRLMALHNEDARSQYTLEDVAAMRLQRRWREHIAVHKLKLAVRTQIAALRVQRFMRDRRERNRWVTLRLSAAGPLEFSEIYTACACTMGQTARATAQQRLTAMTRSACLVQRSCRALLARCRVERRRRAISTVQALFRGCKRRWEVAVALELQCSPTKAWADGSSGNGTRVKWTGCPLQIGIVTRRTAPMDERCATGFGSANLAAFLWEPEQSMEADKDVTSNKTGTLTACGDMLRSCHAESNQTTFNDGAVFELSALACRSTHKCYIQTVDEHDIQRCERRRDRLSGARCYRDWNDGKRDGEWLYSSRLTARLPVQHWTPVAIAPEAALVQALRCSTLIVSSPSFGAGSACRLFSKIGRPRVNMTVASCQPRHSVNQTEADDIQEEGVRIDEVQPALSKTFAVSPAVDRVVRGYNASEEQIRVRSATISREGDCLAHILIHGSSPLGDTGFSMLTSAIGAADSLTRLTTLVIGGSGCSVGPRGLMALAKALSSPGCSRLQYLSLSNCCLGRQRFNGKPSPPPPITSPRPLPAQRTSGSAPVAGGRAAAAERCRVAWSCFFRHLQRMPALSSLSLTDCGLDDRDIQSAAITIQILPSGMLRCLRLGGNAIGVSGLRLLLRALTSRRMRLPALWMRRQRPVIIESEAREVVQRAFEEGLVAEIPGGSNGAESATRMTLAAGSEVYMQDSRQRIRAKILRLSSSDLDKQRAGDRGWHW